MSDKFVFQNARIKSMETKLLTSQTVQRLAECSDVKEAYKLLSDYGFGAGVGGDGNFDAMFAREEEAAAAVLRNFNVDGALNPFLLANDYNNLKAILKASLSGAQNPVLLPYGVYTAEQLENGVIAGDFGVLPAEMVDTVKTVQRLGGGNKLTPHTVDVLSDRAMYKNILASLKKSGKTAKKYFVRKIDYLNISSFLRCRKLDLAEKFFTDGFIDGGELKEAFFLKIYEAPAEAFKDACKFTPYQDIAARAAESGSIIDFEVEVDNTLLKMWKDESDDLFSEAPIVAYALTKQAELKVVKLLVAGIKNHVEPQIIKERMREIYA